MFRAFIAVAVVSLALAAVPASSQPLIKSAVSVDAGNTKQAGEHVKDAANDVADNFR